MRMRVALAGAIGRGFDVSAIGQVVQIDDSKWPTQIPDDNRLKFNEMIWAVLP